MSKKITVLFLMVVLLFSAAAEYFADTEAQFKLAAQYAELRHDCQQAGIILKTLPADDSRILQVQMKLEKLKTNL